MTKYPTDCEGFYRRDFLKIGAAGLLGLSLPQLLRLEAKARAEGGKRRADAVILLWLGGGPATIDMWDLKPDAPAEIRGEFKPIKTNVDGISISEHMPLRRSSATTSIVVKPAWRRAADNVSAVYIEKWSSPV